MATLTPQVLGQYRKTREYVWDVNSLTWVAMQQPVIEGDTIVATITNDGTFARETGGNLALIESGVNSFLVNALGIHSMPTPTYTTMVAGRDGTNARTLHTDTSGDLQVDVLTSALPSGAATAALQTQPGVDIGDVTVNNGSGASAVNVQDGGNSLTVDQGAGAAVSAGWPVNVGQAAVTTASYTSATANLTATTVSMTGYSSVAVQVHFPATITGGLFLFQATVDGVNWVPVVLRGLDSVVAGPNTYIVGSSVRGNSVLIDEIFVGSVTGAVQFRVINDSGGGIFPITGTGTITVAIAPSAQFIESDAFCRNIGTRSNNQAVALGSLSEWIPTLGAIANTSAPSYTDGRGVALSTDTSGVLRAGGPVASGSTKVGSPILNGGVYNTTQPTVTNGQVVDLQATARGALIVGTGVDSFITKETRSATPSQTSVNDTASSTTILASNANRLGATVYNDSTAVLYLKLGATASTTSFTVAMAAASYYEVPFGYTGVIDGIWASDASGAARITELTA